MKRVFLPLLIAATMTSCDVVIDVFEGEEDKVDGKVIVESFEDELPAEGYSWGYDSEFLAFEHFYNEEYGYWGGFAQACSYDMEDGSPANQYSAYNTAAATGEGYMLYYYDSFNEPCDILCRYYGEYNFSTVRLNLTTYTYKTIAEGNDFARAFDEGDFLKVTFTALLKDKNEGESVDCYVVDYRDGKRFVADSWSSFDISALKGALWGIRVTMETSDVGEWGANTPLYICMDDLIYTVSMR